MEQWEATLVAAVAAPTLTVVLAGVLGERLTRQSDLLKRRSELVLDPLERLYQGYADTVSLGRRWITMEGEVDDDKRWELLEDLENLGLELNKAVRAWHVAAHDIVASRL
jgi:hypothetical protein